MFFRQALALLLLGSCFIAVVCGNSLKAKINDKRAALIQAAIDEAKEDAARSQSTAKQSTASRRHSAFKLASPETLAQGKARLLFEDMVRRAEKKILQSRRRANTASLEKNSESLAEALATELLHTPGSIVTEEEIARMYEESRCRKTVHYPHCGTASVKYRTADGTCNNIRNPTYGAANTKYSRLIPPVYEDGISSPRGWTQSQGSPFFGPFSPPNPSPRVVSTDIVQDRVVDDGRYTHILMQWGQFIDHDVDLAPEVERSMCPDGCTFNDVTRCAPFPVPFNDHRIMVSRVSSDTYGCHKFGRSLPACDVTPPSRLTPREQVNSITAFIDGSQVYHHNERVMNDLIRDRSSGRGLLRTGPPVPGTTKPTLPYVTEKDIVACPPPLTLSQCYLAGDARVNEQTGLTVMHTIWMREHNRIATALRSLNPHWNGEKIFQETRKIVGAEIQKITYKDYLPLLLGDLLLLKLLIPDYSGYNDQVNPNIPNAFAAAAYRFGHSQIQPSFDRLDQNYNSLPQGPLQLVDAFFNPSKIVESGGTDPILRGLVTKRARFVDEFLNSILTNKLFATSSTAPGLDLASLNIQRGRDHGLPPYLVWKRWAKDKCGQESDFSSALTETRLLQTYGSLDTVDLFVGGLAERPLPGGLVGATFGCIFAKAFEALRDGDRFYYENTDETTGTFTAEQRIEIEKTSLSRVICDNSDNIQQIQRNAFLTYQVYVFCNQLPQINLNAWYEPLPRFCYARIGVSGNILSGRFLAISSLIQFYSSEITIHGSGCLTILCPQQSRKSAVWIYPPRSNTCSVISHQNLPTSNFVGSYVQLIDTSHVSEASGIYTSESRCSASNVNAVYFSCSRKKVNKQEDVLQSLEQLSDTQEDTETTEDRVDKEITADDPLFINAPEDVQNFLLHNSGGSPTDDVESNDKLISMMEDVLQEQKEQESNNADKETISELSEKILAHD